MDHESLPGAKLKEAIRAEIRRRGIQYKDAAVEIGITRDYLARLMAKNGKLPNADTRLRRIASFLNVSVESVYRMTGIIDDADCGPNPPIDPTIEIELAASHKRMLQHTRWSSSAPSDQEWRSMSVKQRLFMSQLFEQARYDEYLRILNQSKEAQS